MTITKPIKIRLNGTWYTTGTGHYAMYQHGSTWRESAGITNVKLREIYRKANKTGT